MQLLIKNEFGQVHQTKLSQEFSALVIEHSKVNAKISLYGGQVLSWQPCGEKDVFWLSKNSAFEKGKAIRGGIPLCWPWFGCHPNDNEKKEGNHGFARRQLWKIDNVDINEQGVEVCLSWQGANMSDVWPFSCQLKQVLFFGCSFKQSLKMNNLSNDDVYYTGALHNYFLVSSPENIKIPALEQVSFDDKLTGQLCEPQLLENGIGPIDRTYHTNSCMSIVDNYWQRTIELKSKNTNQWVFWNPGVELAKNMADIHHNGEEEFVCLEAANTQMQLISAGESVIVEQEISILNHK